MDEHILSEAVGLLKQLISIPSVSREEEAVADALQNFIEGVGIMAYRSGNNVGLHPCDLHQARHSVLQHTHRHGVTRVAVGTHHPHTPSGGGGRLRGGGRHGAGVSGEPLVGVSGVVRPPAEH